MNLSKSEIVGFNSEDEVIKCFNRRTTDAFSYIYMMYYDALYMFTAKLYVGTEIEAEDVVQDIFLSVWTNKNTVFESLLHIKRYLYLSVRNHFLKYSEHQKSVLKYNKSVKKEDFVSEMIEVEVVSKLSTMIDTLPKDSAAILKMYIEGMDVKEIAKKIDRTERTVYNQKREALQILKEKFSKSPLFSILIILG